MSLVARAAPATPTSTAETASIKQTVCFMPSPSGYGCKKGYKRRQYNAYRNLERPPHDSYLPITLSDIAPFPIEADDTSALPPHHKYHL